METRHAAKHAMRNRQSLAAASHCGCYYCLAEFDPKEIKDWTDEGETAICPYCDVDSVLAESEDCEISREILSRIHNFWF